jgi:hypothetical protein
VLLRCRRRSRGIDHQSTGHGGIFRRLRSLHRAGGRATILSGSQRGLSATTRGRQSTLKTISASCLNEEPLRHMRASL